MGKRAYKLPKIDTVRMLIRSVVFPGDYIPVEEGLDYGVEALASPSQPEPVVRVIRRLLVLLGVFECPVADLDEQFCGQIEKAARRLT